MAKAIGDLVPAYGQALNAVDQIRDNPDMPPPLTEPPPVDAAPPQAETTASLELPLTMGDPADAPADDPADASADDPADASADSIPDDPAVVDERFQNADPKQSEAGKKCLKNALQQLPKSMALDIKNATSPMGAVRNLLKERKKIIDASIKKCLDDAWNDVNTNLPADPTASPDGN